MRDRFPFFRAQRLKARRVVIELLDANHCSKVISF